MREAIDRAIHDLLAGHAVLDAQDILTGSFIEWVKLVEASPAALASDYVDHDGTIRGTRRDPPAAIRLDSLFLNDRWTRLAVEWCFRMFAYHDLAKGNRFERLREFQGASVKHAKDAVFRSRLWQWTSPSTLR